MNKKTEVFQPSGDVARVQRLGLGWRDEKEDRFVRIFDHLGKSHHLCVERDADDIAMLVDMVQGENPDIANRIRTELLAIDSTEFHYLQLEEVDS